MLTLNQIKQKLIAFFENHAQINDVIYADEFEFDAKDGLTYPVANIEFLNASINDRVLSYNFKIVIGDTCPDDTEMQNQTVSDSILIAEDLFSFLQYEPSFVFTKISSIQKFWDDNADRISGVVFTITLQVIRSQNTCAIPVKS